MAPQQGLIPQGYSRWDIVEGWYWFLTDYHEGQWSQKYIRLSFLQRIYQPSILAFGPQTEQSQAVYDSLVQHEKRG